MSNRQVVIICRSRNATAGVQRTSINGLMVWGSHIKQKYFNKNVTENSSEEEIRARIEGNIQMPEWIGGHRFGIFDLLNYVKNQRRYVYDPSVSTRFFDAVAIPSSTSLHIYEHLVSDGFEPINIDNVRENKSTLTAILTTQPLAVVISATFLNAQQIYEIIQLIRKRNQDVPIVLGSDYLITRLDDTGRMPADFEKSISDNVFAILEEGGLAKLTRLLNIIEGNQEYRTMHNIAYRDNGSVRYTEKKEVHHDIDLAYPDWERVSDVCKDAAFIRASHGCPYKCKFCTFPSANVRFRQRSVESIRDELRRVRAAGITNVAFTDDHFAISPKRVQEICDMMKAEAFDFNWFAGIRANAINETNARLLSETGCKVLCVGLESGDDRMLKLINKKTTVAGNMKCLEILEDNDITAYGSFLLGFPGETTESIENTINWINQSPLRLYKVFLFYLLPNSIVFDEQEQHNISFFGESHDYCLWRTPTLDALRTSELLKEFIMRIENAALIYNYSPMYAFFPFFSQGISMKESLALLKIRTDIVKSELSDESYFNKRRYRKRMLDEIEKMLSTRG